VRQVIKPPAVAKPPTTVQKNNDLDQNQRFVAFLLSVTQSDAQLLVKLIHKDLLHKAVLQSVVDLDMLQSLHLQH